MGNGLVKVEIVISKDNSLLRLRRLQELAKLKEYGEEGERRKLFYLFVEQGWESRRDNDLFELGFFEFPRSQLSCE